MKCRSCHSPMVVNRSESSKRATTCWHQCPLCKQVRLTSECDPVNPNRLTDLAHHSDDDTGYGADTESQSGTSYLFS